MAWGLGQGDKVRKGPGNGVLWLLRMWGEEESGSLPQGASQGVRSPPPVSISLGVFSCLFGTGARSVICTVLYQGDPSVARWIAKFIYLTNT